MRRLIKKTKLTLLKNIVIWGIIFLASVCQAYTEISWWTISAGKERIIEFLSEDINLYCHGRCQAYSVVGRPDEIFVLSMRKDILKALIRGDEIKGHSQEVVHYENPIKKKKGRILVIRPQQEVRTE